MPKFWKKLTHQEILSYPISHEKGFCGKEVRFGGKNRGSGLQPPILDI